MILFRNLPKDLIQGLSICLVGVSFLGLLLLGVAAIRPKDFNVKVHNVSIYQTAQNRTVKVH